MIHYWYMIHRWTSLVCAGFALLLCLTGLPLIFKAEIEASNASNQPLENVVDTPFVSLDRLTKASLTLYPGQNMAYISLDEEDQLAYVGITSVDTKEDHWIKFDAHTAQVLEQSKLPENNLTFIDLMSGLHRNMLMGERGHWFLGFMCLVFMVALVSGVVIYSPFMKTLPFGTLRLDIPRRAWLDWHKLIGMVTLVWAATLSLTGMLFVVYEPLENLWKNATFPAILASYQGQPLPTQLSSLQLAVDTVETALPGQRVSSITYPNEITSSPYHYLIWTKGTTPLTAYLQTPTLIDAATGELTATFPLPWYMKVLSFAGPLHYGNHKGLPLKFLWALLDLLTIGMLISGIYAWVLKGRKPPILKDVPTGAQRRSTTQRPIRQSAYQIWGIPIVLSVLTLFAMIAPLLGPGIWQWLSCVALTIPIVVTIWYWILPYPVRPGTKR